MSDATYLVRWVTNAIAVGSSEAGFSELSGVEVKDFDRVDGHAIVVFADDWESSEVVEQSQSIGCEIDRTTNGGRNWPNLKDLDVGYLASWGKLCQGQSRRQAGNTTTQDENIEPFVRGS